MRNLAGSGSFVQVMRKAGLADRREHLRQNGTRYLGRQYRH